MAPKLYATTAPIPPGDVTHAVNPGGRLGTGGYITYVLAESKNDAIEAIYHAYSGSSVAARDLKVVTEHDKDASMLREAGLFANAGDVVTTDYNHGLGVSLVRMAPEAVGDLQRVGEWGSEKDADGFGVKFFQPVKGDKVMKPIDPAMRRMLLEQRANDERETAIHKAAERAVERVADFLDARTLTFPADKPVDSVIHTVDTDGRYAELTTTDLIDLIEFYREMTQ